MEGGHCWNPLYVYDHYSPPYLKAPLRVNGPGNPMIANPALNFERHIAS